MKRDLLAGVEVVGAQPATVTAGAAALQRRHGGIAQSDAWRSVAWRLLATADYRAFFARMPTLDRRDAAAALSPAKQCVREGLS